MIIVFFQFFYAAPSQTRYDAKWNERRINDITQEILKLIGPANLSQPISVNVDNVKIKEMIRQQFGGQEDDALGDTPKVDIRDKEQLRDEAIKLVRLRPEFADYQPEVIFELCREVDEKYPLYPEGKFVKVIIKGKQYEGCFKRNGTRSIKIGEKSFGFSSLPKEALALFDSSENTRLRKIELCKNAILEQEIKDLEKKYPMYKEGQVVEITFARGNEPRRTYKGVFKLNGPYKLWIGRDMLNKNDLPQILRARFYPDENAKCRQAEFNKHLILSKMELKFSDAVADEIKNLRQKQFETNLPKGWVYLNERWLLPEDLVEDTIKYCEHIKYCEYKRKEEERRIQAEEEREIEEKRHRHGKLEDYGPHGHFEMRQQGDSVEGIFSPVWVSE